MTTALAQWPLRISSLMSAIDAKRIIRKHRPAGFRREIGFIRRATPDVIARIDRLHLRREIGADTGPESITSDQQIGALTAAIGEIDVNAAAVLLDTLEHMS